MKNIRKLIEKASSPSDWDFANEVLYRLCTEYPNHTDAGVVTAKVWLIGRSYAAAIERGRQDKKESEDFYLHAVAPKIISSRIDEWLAATRELIPTTSTLSALVNVHGNTTNLFSKISGKENRSLASKYLHFHQPNLFFIYDSRAVSAIGKLSHLTGRAKRSSGAGDNEYRKFAEKCVNLQDAIKDRFGKSLSPRHIDNLLLAI